MFQRRNFVLFMSDSARGGARGGASSRTEAENAALLLLLENQEYK